jgi:predicted lysophospholipase L1 biosynthesis ABC-type transport system permease subunit
VVINETMAARIWPGEEPLGRMIHLRDAASDPVLVVGVVEDGKYNDIEETQQPYLYLPFTQMPWGEVLLLAETAGDPNLLAPAVRDVIKRLSPDTYLLPQSTMAGILRDATYNRQLMALALGIFTLLGLALALVGLYGVSAYSVNRRSREIGIRMALGADDRRIVRLVLAQGGRLVLIGTGLGLPAAVVVAFVLRGRLYGVSPLEPLSLVASTVILALAMLVAVLIPGRRAIRVDPQTVMREE